jgi:hypothetical protein
MKIPVLCSGLAGIVLTMSNQTLYAVPITGNIGFSGAAQLNTKSVHTATKVTSWLPTIVNADSGSFTSVAIGSGVTLASSWFFNSGPVSDFWSVGGFTFDLLSSSIASQQGLFLDVSMAGTVSGNGFTASPFTGTFQVADPSADGNVTFTERLSFANVAATVPDGGSTLMMLGLAGLAMTVAKRYLPQDRTV